MVRLSRAYLEGLPGPVNYYQGDREGRPGTLALSDYNPTTTAT
ncbi:MAG: hypothetical protein ABI465_00800 [Ktedonobacteraceae bacterium]